MSGKEQANNNSDDLIMKLWINLYGENDDDNITILTSETLADNSDELQEVRVIVLMVTGAVGALIIGSLLCCMCYKNERVLQSIPGTKEYKRRQKEPEYFYPIPRLGAIRMVASQGNSVAFLANHKLLEKGFLKDVNAKSDIKIKIADTDAEKKENSELKIEGDDGTKSDESSFNESDGLDDEGDVPNNTFPAGGGREVRNKKKTKKSGHKRGKRLRKKNKYSTAIFVKGKLLLTWTHLSSNGTIIVLLLVNSPRETSYTDL